MRYNGQTYVGRSANSLDVSPQFEGISRVVLIIDENHEVSAGSTTGRTLTADLPWATQAIANHVLSLLQGYRYQPYTATGVYLDPAAELGDGIGIADTYGCICQLTNHFGPLFRADVSAPEDEEIDHETPWVSKADRKIQRKIGHLESELAVTAGKISAEVTDRTSDIEELRAALEVQAGQISATVESRGGDWTSFGWLLSDKAWSLFADNTEVLRADRAGVVIEGEIRAKSGTIGGFDILEDSIRYNGQPFGGGNNVGVYFGPQGLQLGNAFSVDAWGHMIAESGEFRGTVRAGQILTGGDNGYFSGAGLAYGSVEGAVIAPYTISTYNTSGGINASLANADYARDALNGIERFKYMHGDQLAADSVRANVLSTEGRVLTSEMISYTGGDGRVHTRRFWMADGDFVA